MKSPLFLVWFFIPCLAVSQNAYYDAIELKKYVSLVDNNGTVILDTTGHTEEIVKICHRYLPPSDSISYQDVSESFNGNPFLEIPHSASVESRALGYTMAPGKKFFSSVSGLDVTNIANALADIMIERAKQELTVSFFNQFKKFINQYQEVQVLFPKTSDRISNLLAEKYPEMLPALRKCFQEDIHNLPYTITQVFQLPKYHALLKNYPEVRIFIRSLDLIRSLEKEKHPAVILEQLASFKEWGESQATDFKNVGNSIKLANIFSQSLLNDPSLSGEERGWVNETDFVKFVENDTLITIYLGLIYENSERDSIYFYHNGQNIKSFTDIMDENKDNIFLFQTRLKRFIELADNVDVLVKEIDKKKVRGEKISHDEFYEYISLSIDVIEFGFNIVNMFDEKVQVGDYVALTRKSNDLYKNIYKEEYNLAVMNSVDVLSLVIDLINKESNWKINQLNKMATAAGLSNSDMSAIDSLSKDFQKGSKKFSAIGWNNLARNIRLHADLYDLAKEIRDITQKGNYNRKALHSFNKFVSKLSKYGVFMANLVEAKTSDEAKAVIESAILPVGSSSIKKNSDLNISIQSYLGAFYQPKPSNKLGYAWNDKFGVIAPIGISINYGMRRGGCIGLFGSLIDIGAIVDYRLSQSQAINDQGITENVVNKDYKVRLGQLFSPGTYVVYGFPCNIPLSFGVGAQYGPGLGKIDAGQAIVGNPTWRYNFFLAVDLPFFTAYNLPKNRKNKR